MTIGALLAINTFTALFLYHTFATDGNWKEAITIALVSTCGALFIAALLSSPALLGSP